MAGLVLTEYERMRVAVPLAVLALTLTWPGLALAQERIVLSTDSSCAGCTMEITLLARLGGQSSPVSPSHRARRVVRDSRGRYIVPAVGDTELLVYDSTGRYLRTLGRFGNGPGEYNLVMNLAISSDSLFVFDYGGRLTVLTPEGEVARTALSRFVPLRALALRDGSLIVSGPYHSPTSLGQPLHRISTDGTVEKSFGYEVPRTDRDRPSLRNRKIAWHDTSSFWSVRPDRYEIELIGIEGDLQKTLVRGADWFPPRDYERGPTGTRPPPYVRDITVDSAGRIWTMLYVASRDWKPVRKAGQAVNPALMDADLDTIIEVIDPGSARLVASTRLDIMLEGFASPGIAFRYVEDEDGDTVIQILSLRLAGLTSH